MLIICSSCNSKYLVNSADLKPAGRNVKCAKCGNNWFQTPSLTESESLLHTASSNEKEYKDNSQNKLYNNLPSTFVHATKPSTFNSILVILILFLLLTSFWFYKHYDLNFVKYDITNILELVKFFLGEFYFNIQLIINDIAKIFHQILN